MQTRRLFFSRRFTLVKRTKLNRNKALLTIVPLRWSQTSPNKEQSKSTLSDKQGFWDKLIKKQGAQNLIAPPDYNRWRAVPLAVTTHLCLGACYAWSIFNEPLTRELGIVATSASDWPLSSVVITFTGIIVAQGLTMATVGKWVEKVGPRIAGCTGAILYGGGMLVGSLGVASHTLPLIYLGYGAIAGAGMGISYLPPIATLIKWFPDRRGLATGMAVMGFGGGALFIAKIKKRLLAESFVPPQYVGSKESIITKWGNDGRLLAHFQQNNEWKEVVYATKSELSRIGLSNLNEGLYLVGTGSTGVAQTMGILGLGYLAVCFTNSLLVKIPGPNYVPKNMVQTNNDNKKPETQKALTTHVHVDDVMKTPQFWLLWITFLSTGTAGLGLMSCAKDVLQCSFTKSSMAIDMGPAAFATAYIQALSVANLGGRLVWASASDKIGRKSTFALFACLGGPLYFSLPYIISTQLLDVQSTAPLYLFYGSTMLIISFFGGSYSTIPAYESDLFGSKYIASIHGRTMTASALAGIIGPMIFAKWRANEEKKSILNLSEICDTSKFQEKFGTKKENIQTLIDAKQINIAKLLDVCPPNTVDPTPFLYDPAFKTMGVIMGIGAVANFLVRPVNKKWLKTA